MKIIFPNPYGYKLPKQERVASMQEAYGFSSEYADFLVSQNGFSIHNLEEDPGSEKYLVRSKYKNGNSPEFRILYGLDSGDQHYDLQDNLDSFVFKQVFFPIGVDYGGNELVEILAGRFKGHIASIDHEMYAGSGSLGEFADEFELDEFEGASDDEKANMLADEGLGLAWVVAFSMKYFLEECIHCDTDFTGFIVEAVGKEG